MPTNQLKPTLTVDELRTHIQILLNLASDQEDYKAMGPHFKAISERVVEIVKGITPIELLLLQNK